MSKNLVRMQKAKESAGQGFLLASDHIIVEKMPIKEVKIGSIVLAAGDRQSNGFNSNEAEFVRVLLVGEGYYDDVTKESVPLDVLPGNIIEVGRNSVNWWSRFGDIILDHKIGTGIGLSKADQYRLKFDSEGDYLNFINELSKESS